MIRLYHSHLIILALDTLGLELYDKGGGAPALSCALKPIQCSFMADLTPVSKLIGQCKIMLSLKVSILRGSGDNVLSSVEIRCNPETLEDDNNNIMSYYYTSLFSFLLS